MTRYMLIGCVLMGWLTAAVASEPPADALPDAPDAPADDKGLSKSKEAFDLDAFLAETLTAEDYRDSQSCMHTRNIDRFEILNSEFLLVHGRRDELWLNRFRHRCVGLRRKMILISDNRNRRLCSLDRVQGFNRAFGPQIDQRGRVFGGTTCVLGDFEAVNLAQVEALKAALKAAKRR